MIKRLSFLSVIVLLLVVILVLAPGSACDQGVKQAEVPAGPPQVTSFKVASQFTSEDQAPLFTWEATNASSVTITQYGEVVYHIEAVPYGESGAFLTPMHDKAYASSTSEKEIRRLYSPGVYPIEFLGSSTGKPTSVKYNNDFWTQKGNVSLFRWEGTPNFGNQGWWDSHCRPPDHSFVTLGGDVRSIWQFGDTKEGEHQAIITDAVMDVRSPDGQLVTTKIPVAVVQEGDPLAPSAQSLITPPPCVRSGSSTPIIPGIKRWAVKNPVIKDGEAPQFEFEVSNPHIISIRHGDEYISSVEIVNPPVTSSMSLPPFTDKAQASNTSEYVYKQPYVLDIPPTFRPSQQTRYLCFCEGKPPVVAWRFGEKSREDSAEITVCSPTGDIVSATVNFTIMRVEEQAPAVMLPPVISFTTSRNVVAPMDPVTFTYRITGADNAWLISDGSKEAVPMSGSKEIIILKSACYYLTAENPAGRASEQQCITVASSGFIPPPDIDEPPCPPPAPPLAPPPLAPPPVAPITDGH